jgi:hypothetical protein
VLDLVAGRLEKFGGRDQLKMNWLARLRQPVLNLGDCVLRPWQATDADAVAQATPPSNFGTSDR